LVEANTRKKNGRDGEGREDEEETRGGAGTHMLALL
jgi:hypothetical protein